MCSMKVLPVVVATLIVAFASVAANAQNEEAEANRERLRIFWYCRRKAATDNIDANRQQHGLLFYYSLSPDE